MLTIPIALALALSAAAQHAPAAGAVPPEPRASSVSILTVPVYLGQKPPPVRSLRNIQLVHTGVPNAARDVKRTRAEALELGRHLVALVEAGQDFVELAREYSAAGNAATGAVLGTVPPGLLAKPMDEFLFAADVGAVSTPLDTSSGVHVLQRIDTLAATRHILISGRSEESRRRCEALLARIRAGEDFGALAREHSDDPYSAPRDGLFTIFERGSSDRLLRAAAFAAVVGETVGPIESPSGYHLIQRVAVEGHDPSLLEVTWVRARVILLAHKEVRSGVIFHERSPAEAAELAKKLHRRIRAGEDMAALAREYDDDLTGRDRAGDLGWLHRGNPRTLQALRMLFKAEPGELFEPIPINLGWVIVRRER